MKVLVLGSGGAASNGFARALRLAGGYELVGTNANPNDLLLSECDRNYLIAPVSDYDAWRADLLHVVKLEHPDFVHAQSDREVAALGLFRDRLHMIGWRADHPDGRLHTFLPRNEVIEVCQDKWASYLAWREAGVAVPRTWLPDGNWPNGEWWLRPRVGAGGQRSLRTDDRGWAEEWLHQHDGWDSSFTVAEALTDDSVTVQALYWDGELVCSQQRTRASWAHAGLTVSGVSGSTGVGVTSSHPLVDQVARDAVAAVDGRPHGLFGVDMTYRSSGLPLVTEINIGRFFTTAPEFYAMAGFNMADLYVRFGVGAAPTLKSEEPIINPLPDGWRWIRGMDRAPLLTAPSR